MQTDKTSRKVWVKHWIYLKVIDLSFDLIKKNGPNSALAVQIQKGLFQTN